MSVDAGDVRIRRSGIGGSDIAKLVGQSHWGGPMDLYLEKIGQSAPLIETERMRWGKILEDAVAREYANKEGVKVRRNPTTVDPVTHLRARVIRHSAEKPWRMANVDRLTGDPDRGLECKTADGFRSADFGEEHTDQVPPDYALQCHWYMAVTGKRVWDLAVLIGGNQHRVYRIGRDDELVDMLFSVADAFWLDNVVPQVAPAIDESEASRRFLEAGHLAPEDEIPMSDAMVELADRYESARLRIKRLELLRDGYANRIREAMQGHGIARSERAKVRWSVNTVRRVDTKALREEEPKLAARFTRETEEHRLTVTVKEAS